MRSEIIHHGGRDGVTGSCHQLLFGNGDSILIDCGLFQGAETAADGRGAEDALAFRMPVSAIRALVVSHVHIDHVGRIPWLLAAGFKGPIICSEPSARLLPTVLADAFALGIARDPQLVQRYIDMVEARLHPLPYRRWLRFVSADGTECRIRLQRAGHILGSAYVECDLRRPGEKPERILFSGDLGAPHAPLLPAPRPPWRADVVVLESTYGDRLHEGRRDRRLRLKKIVEHALDNGAR
ncbi:MBL fold metallo-hydrolase [Azoarcus olearius]|uniref:Exonuclease of the beta-lactamase fold involved in RNA processing n=1 Tax=Azoarcus sp. (strain BH72) TaxID=418699 RepID=A1KAP8_AZOSB|nr:MBL fold metallo-hydrolase [Azoarcus olearius]CAL95904.1 exonuclease of the beta-lactamase fold involved in RNA processing [Azoarcus olearius]